MLESHCIESRHLWAVVAKRLDELSRLGQIGPDIERIVAETDLVFTPFLAAATNEARLLSATFHAIPSHYEYCETVYRQLYIKMYTALARPTDIVIPLSAVPIDPASLLCHIQSQNVTASLPMDNETLLKYPTTSRLSSRSGIEALLADIKTRYTEAALEIYTRAQLPEPCDEQAAMMAIETPLSHIRALDQPIRAFLEHLNRLCEALNRTRENIQILTDNILVKFAEVTRLYDNMTKTYRLALSRRPLETHVTAIF